jgi:prepilin peptidase CpaA
MGGAANVVSWQPSALADTSSTLSIAGFSFPLTIQATILLVLAGIVAWAAISDLIHSIIPNTANTAIFVLWVVWVVTGGPASVLYAVLIGLGVFVFGAVLFHFGQMGGGDVKLLTVLSIWAGPTEVIVFMIHVALAGGLLTVLWTMHLRFVAPAFGRLVEAEGRRVVPYGVAIAAGAFLLIARMWTG